MADRKFMPVIDFDPPRVAPIGGPIPERGLCEFSIYCTMRQANRYSRLYQVVEADGDVPAGAGCHVERKPRRPARFVARLPLSHLQRFMQLIEPVL